LAQPEQRDTVSGVAVEPPVDSYGRAILARIAQARLRQQIAADTVALCRKITGTARPDAATALSLHDAHARHARELGRHAAAERAEERFDRELHRLTRS
jgi:hypothetical protein